MSDPKRKPLYQPWNEEAFRADLQVYAMTPAQRWMYRTSLQAAFFCSTRPYLPDDDAQLWMLAGCENPKQWDRNKDVVRAMFTPVETDGVRLLSQKRLLADWNRLEEKRQMLAENGRKGRKAQLESGHGSADVGQMPGNCPVNDGPGPGLAGQEKLKEVKGSEVSKENPSSEAVASDEQVSKSTPRKEPSPDGTELANLLRAGIIGNNPDANVTESHVREWGREADRMMRKDKRTLAAIRELIEFSQADPFWWKNIRSMATLRKQFDQLWVKRPGSAKQAPAHGSMPQRRSELNDEGRAVYERAGVAL